MTPFQEDFIPLLHCLHDKTINWLVTFGYTDIYTHNFRFRPSNSSHGSWCRSCGRYHFLFTIFSAIYANRTIGPYKNLPSRAKICMFPRQYSLPVVPVHYASEKSFSIPSLSVHWHGCTSVSLQNSFRKLNFLNRLNWLNWARNRNTNASIFIIFELAQICRT